jgi:hypothetical protein
VKWVIGFQGPKARVENIISFIPEFVVQATIGYQGRNKNTAVDSMRLSLVAPPFIDTTFLIQLRGRDRNFPSVFRLSGSGIPWGLSLEGCSSCDSSMYLEAKETHFNTLSITCRSCGGSGTAERPECWNADMISAKRNVWMVAIPDQGPVPIKWTNIEKCGTPLGDDVKHSSQITAVRTPHLIADCNSDDGVLIDLLILQGCFYLPGVQRGWMRHRPMHWTTTLF